MQPITIVYQHADFVVIDKPVGISVQDEDAQSGILPIVCQQLQLSKLWLVHRIDKVTSGLLILAKSAEAARKLSQLFAQRKMTKIYLAICDNKPAKKMGNVIGDMKKSRRGQWKLTRDMDSPAITQFTSIGLGEGKRLIIVKPLTGKTHQIRVALKSLGSPILGDSLYGGNQADRTYLHAYALAFEYGEEKIEVAHAPDNGEYFTTQACSEATKSFALWQDGWPKIADNIRRKVTHQATDDSLS